jgi:hypothetical protein
MKSEFKTLLQRNYRNFIKNNRVIIPEDLEISKENNTITIKYSQKHVTSNMQTDKVCFEGWALLFHTTEKLAIEVDWDEPIFSEKREKKGQAAEYGHYQRFLYRLKKFDQQFPWFKVSKPNLVNSQFFYSSDPTIINLGDPKKRKDKRDQKTKGKRTGEYTEDELESLLTFDNQISNDLKNNLNLKEITNQFPVGVFKGTVSKTSRVFTGGKSAIDIIGISKENKASVIELKRGGGKNKKLGIISELFFYSNIINDIQNNEIQLESEPEGFYQNLFKTKGVNGVMLAPEFHPCIEKNEIIDLLNQNSEIDYLVVKIEGDTPNSIKFK